MVSGTATNRIGAPRDAKNQIYVPHTALAQLD